MVKGKNFENFLYYDFKMKKGDCTENLQMKKIPKFI